MRHYSKPLIIPAILDEDFSEITKKMVLFEKHAPLVQVDILDGCLVPKTTWPYVHDLNGDSAFPEVPTIEYHLMLRYNLPFIKKYLLGKVGSVLLQIESRDFELALKLLKDMGVLIGLSIMLDTDLKKLEPFLGVIDILQFMSIDEIGIQGSGFSERVFDKIEQFKSLYSKYSDSTILAVDGGVSFDNIAKLHELGVERFAVGSSIFATKEPVATWVKMSNFLT